MKCIFNNSKLLTELSNNSEHLLSAGSCSMMANITCTTCKLVVCWSF